MQESTRAMKVRLSPRLGFLFSWSPFVRRPRFPILWLCGLLFGWSALGAFASPIRLLTIGNSFADNATVYLPALAEAGGHELILGKANLGGHSLEQHATYLQLHERDLSDPKGCPYSFRGAKVSLQEILSREAWDIVTIQQVSNLSFRPDSYEPFAGEVVDAIRELAPSARIYVHQTWAYREDHPLLKREGLTQEAMFARLKSAYAGLASRYEAPILPCGAAFQRARALPEWRFRGADEAFDFGHPESGRLPVEMGGLNIGWTLQKNSKTGHTEYVLDAKHANKDGQYLAACVFYQCLWGGLDRVTWHPAEVPAERAAKLRDCAIAAVAEAKTSPYQASVR